MQTQSTNAVNKIGLRNEQTASSRFELIGPVINADDMRPSLYEAKPFSGEGFLPAHKQQTNANQVQSEKTQVFH